jgi:nucleoside-diphosphate-sugar epimerase
MRRSEEEIRERRKKRETIFLVTGGTGFIGSHIAVALLEKGYPVILLCRGTRGLTARERIVQILDWFGLATAKRARLEIFDSSLEIPHFGLAMDEYTVLATRADEIIHCAASTAFSERKRQEAEAANILGLRNVLDLAADGTCSFFHHISTAYVAGNRRGECREEFVETSRFMNVYEETKYHGEKLAFETCRQTGIRLNIFRPSIIHGNSISGRSIRFNALYYPIKALVFLRDVYEKDIQENGGVKAGAMGITIERDDLLHMPIRIEGMEDGSIDLIPIDYFVRAFMAIMEDCLEGDIFHIVNGRPKRLGELINYTKEFFSVTGIRTAGQEEFRRIPRTALEELFGGYIAAYMPYINDSRVFSKEKAEAILQRNHILCPVFDFRAFSRCMRYAVSVDWGKKLFRN